jgi:hypothetical protein
LQWKFLWPFGLFHSHLVYFLAILYILWPFGIICGHFVYFIVKYVFDLFFPSLICCRYLEKSGNPLDII